MSDAREWLTAAVVTDPATTVACQNALLAVLDLHQPYDGTGAEAEPGPWCYGCDEGYRLVEWPCVTVQDINKALGVSDE